MSDLQTGACEPSGHLCSRDSGSWSPSQGKHCVKLSNGSNRSNGSNGSNGSRLSRGQKFQGFQGTTGHDMNTEKSLAAGFNARHTDRSKFSSEPIQIEEPNRSEFNKLKELSKFNAFR